MRLLAYAVDGRLVRALVAQVQYPDDTRLTTCGMCIQIWDLGAVGAEDQASGTCARAETHVIANNVATPRLFVV